MTDLFPAANGSLPFANNMNPKSAKTFVWASVISLLFGTVIMSPAGGFFLYALAALAALIPAIFGGGRLRIAGILFAGLLGMPGPALLAAPNLACGASATLAELIANPAAYHGKALSVVGYVTIEFENMTLCPSATETRMSDCLWLTIDDGPHRTDADFARYQSKRQVWDRFHRKTVAIKANFDQVEKGHFSMWPGGLGKVTKVNDVSGQQAGWNFTANAALPHKIKLPSVPGCLPSMLPTTK